MFKQNFQQFYKKVIISILILIAIYVIGIAGYIFIEKMTLLDAVFMTTITITTVGYGVVKELSKAGTIFTIILIILGTGTAAYILINLADFLLSEFLLDRFQIRRVSKMISKLNNHYIICGLGRVGYEIALELNRDKADFVVIDSADEPIAICKENNWLYIQGDASSDSNLIEAGVKKAKVLFAALDTESENVYITLSSKALNPKILVVARATRYETINKLERAGADRVVSPQIIGGRRMVALAKQPAIVDFLDSILSTEEIELSLAEIEVKPECRIDGMTIKEASEKYQFEALIISIIESGQKVMINKASPNTIIKGGHKLIVVGTVEQIQKLSDLAV
ncbi:MAG: potassium channel protein [Actinobacteria bacterium]|nr:potassium channel protein [Actinomycetota bacterium]